MTAASASKPVRSSPVPEIRTVLIPPLPLVPAISRASGSGANTAEVSP